MKKLVLVVSTLLLGACACREEILVCSYGGAESFRSAPTTDIRLVYEGRAIYQLSTWNGGKTYTPREGEYCEVQPVPQKIE